MPYWRQFNDFDPTTRQVPYHRFGLVRDIIWRAQILLGQRSADEIRAAANMIDWIIEDFFQQERHEFIDDQLENDGWAKYLLLKAVSTDEDLDWFVEHDLPNLASENDNFDFFNSENTNEVDALKKCIDNYDLFDDEFSHGTKSECFAVLALRLAVDCMKWTGKFENGSYRLDPKATSSRYSLAAESALLAMDAVCFAEQLEDLQRKQKTIDELQKELGQHNEEIEQRAELLAKKRRSANARKAAMKRHKETAMLKQSVIDHYEQHESEYKSIEDAARKIAGTIVNVVPRTAAKYISNHIKKKQSARKV